MAHATVVLPLVLATPLTAAVPGARRELQMAVAAADR
jgi:hypothetical protein